MWFTIGMIVGLLLGAALLFGWVKLREHSPVLRSSSAAKDEDEV